MEPDEIARIANIVANLIAEQLQPLVCKIYSEYYWNMNRVVIKLCGDNLDASNSAERTIQLRALMSHKFTTAVSPKERTALASFYVQEWGGVRGNRPETLALYAQQTPDQMIADNRTGVASWSKVLCLHDPARFAILDARVAFSLNALQHLSPAPGERVYFPRFPGRNLALALVLNQAQWNRHPALTAQGICYAVYLKILGILISGGQFTVQLPDGGEGPAGIEHIEMALFTHAVTLANQIGAA